MLNKNNNVIIVKNNNCIGTILKYCNNINNNVNDTVIIVINTAHTGNNVNIQK